MVLYKNSFILLGNIQQQLTKVNWRSKISMFTTGSISEGWPSASHKRASPQFLSILGVSISSTDRESRGKYHKLHEWNTIINSHLSQVQGEKKKDPNFFLHCRFLWYKCSTILWVLLAKWKNKDVKKWQMVKSKAGEKEKGENKKK